MSDIYIIGDKDYLMHHGIKGQKWGIENGPPYPLSPSKDYSAAEKKANKILNKADKVINNKARIGNNKAYNVVKSTYKTEHKLPFGSAATIGTKSVRDDKYEKQLISMKNKLSKLSNKYYNDKDIIKNLNSYHKELDSIIKDFNKTKLSPELANYGKQAFKDQNFAQYWAGIPGRLIMEAAQSKDLIKMLDNKEIKLS